MRDKSMLAKAYIRAHPAEFLRLSTIRFIRFWTGTGSKDGSVIFAVHAVLTTFLGAMGMWRLCARGCGRVAVLFLLPLMLFPLPYYMTHAEFRYRLVVDPLLTMLAAYALSGDSWESREAHPCLGIGLAPGRDGDGARLLPAKLAVQQGARPGIPGMLDKFGPRTVLAFRGVDRPHCFSGAGISGFAGAGLLFLWQLQFDLRRRDDGAANGVRGLDGRA